MNTTDTDLALLPEYDRRVYDAVVAAIERKPTDLVACKDLFDVIRNASDARKGNLRYGYKLVGLTADLKGRLRKGNVIAKSEGDGQFALDAYKLNRRILCWEGTDVFDSFALYMEMNRLYDKQFYLPRRKQLLPVAMAMQDLAERKLTLLCVSLPPGVGKTTLAMFFLCWLAGRDPEKPMLTGSHNKDFLSGVYGECLRLLDPQGEYLWNDVFPDVKVVSTNAKTLMIDIADDVKRTKRFTTLEFTSIGSGNAGKVRAENILYCDDLVDGLQTAVSAEQLQKLFNMYSTDLRQRKIGDCAELHIATRWSVHDVIGRLEAMYGESSKAKFIVIPALDENDESNFNYPIEAGFTTEFYHEQRAVMDDASWRALFMNIPIEREGLLASENELRRYFELPDGEPDAILSVCDTKDRGTDYCVMPIVYQYGNDFYVDDVVCDNSNPDIVEPRLVSKCLEHKIQLSRFESNSAGGRIAEKVQNEVKSRGGRTKITTKYTTQNKETKIIVNSPWWKEHCLFKDNSVIKENKEYRKFMSFLCSYTMMSRNKNDDVPDAMAQFAEFVQGMTQSQVSVFKRPF